MKEQFEKYMAECPAVAILRGITNEEVPAICDALYEGGIRLLEIPLNSPNAVESIAIAARHCEGRQLVGAGTVLTPEDVIAVYKAGGKFIISPDCYPDVIRRTLERNMVSIPGALTPTEIMTAHRCGADFAKLFPVSQLGIPYVKSITAPISHVKLLAVGGVNETNVADYLRAGLWGAGIGGNLANRKWIEAGEYHRITETARNIVSQIKNTK